MCLLQGLEAEWWPLVCDDHQHRGHIPPALQAEHLLRKGERLRQVGEASARLQAAQRLLCLFQVLVEGQHLLGRADGAILQELPVSVLEDSHARLVPALGPTRVTARIRGPDQQLVHPAALVRADARFELRFRAEAHAPGCALQRVLLVGVVKQLPGQLLALSRVPWIGRTLIAEGHALRVPAADCFAASHSSRNGVSLCADGLFVAVQRVTRIAIDSQIGAYGSSVVTCNKSLCKSANVVQAAAAATQRLACVHREQQVLLREALFIPGARVRVAHADAVPTVAPRRWTCRSSNCWLQEHWPVPLLVAPTASGRARLPWPPMAQDATSAAGCRVAGLCLRRRVAGHASVPRLLQHAASSLAHPGAALPRAG
mmetsp:Transcript_128012/g.356240  ORF Transcript_128012/g.356240 Transcript_128012/m.356240 type:complete len:372 (-) Transcript_128012:1148-2263(-)